ncbi:hypothetical protein [Ruania halotolerans]|uniref:hypothetical protein n=1 Tax=Ruania halotolerans TaxID=2897773 RepID=UPI001E6267DF|nr:hypothetical protein [Ruania halotolerans]UFU08099.1 hypothetical protein LQF10_08390 [Ruania halotolerans]
MTTAIARTTGAVAVVLVLAGIVSGCIDAAPADQNPATTGAERGSEQSPPRAGDGASKPTMPPQLAECGEGDDKSRTPELAAATWSTPAGFAQASGYSQIAPIAPTHTDWYLVPEEPGDGVEVIAVVHYEDVPARLSDECGVVDRQAVNHLLEQWRADAGVTVSDVVWTRVAGADAVQQTEQYPGRDFTVRTTVFVGTGELLTVSCQWTSRRELMVTGCEEFLASVRLEG